MQYDADQRVILVREALLEGKAWDPLQRFEIRKTGKAGYRCIDVPTIIDQAMIYCLTLPLAPLVESLLGKNLISYRQGMPLASSARRIQKALTKRPWVKTFDFVDFFGSLGWKLLDNSLDQLRVDDALKQRLSSLFRIEVINRDSQKSAQRSRGLPQGLGVSPMLSNLAIADAHKAICHQLSRRGGTLFQYSDDQLQLERTLASQERSEAIIRDRVSQIGLTLTSGPVCDTRETPVTWLGLSFGSNGIDVPTEIIDRKIHHYEHQARQKLMDRSAAEDSLEGLLAHYRRLLTPRRFQEISHTLRTRVDSISFPIPSTSREEEYLGRYR